MARDPEILYERRNHGNKLNYSIEIEKDLTIHHL